jgi:protein-disulfide isomerase
LAAVLVAVLSCFLFTQSGLAAIEWKFVKQMNLGVAPLDVSSSPDGKMIFVLVKGEILVFSGSGQEPANRIPVDPGFDRLSYSPDDNIFILTSSTDKKLVTIQFEEVFAFDLSGNPIRGAADAPVTLAVFTDYQCRYCARLEPMLQQLLTKYPGKLKLVNKNFPLNSHALARNAAAAALAADKQGKYWEFSAELFKNFQKPDNAKIDEIAKSMNMDVEKLHKDMQDPAIQKMITRDVEEGKMAGIRGTPTLFVNGRMVKQRSWSGIQQMINEALKQQK